MNKNSDLKKRSSFFSFYPFSITSVFAFLSHPDLVSLASRELLHFCVSVIIFIVTLRITLTVVKKSENVNFKTLLFLGITVTFISDFLLEISPYFISVFGDLFAIYSVIISGLTTFIITCLVLSKKLETKKVLLLSLIVSFVTLPWVYTTSFMKIAQQANAQIFSKQLKVFDGKIKQLHSNQIYNVYFKYPASFSVQDRPNDYYEATLQKNYGPTRVFSIAFFADGWYYYTKYNNQESIKSWFLSIFKKTSPDIDSSQIKFEEVKFKSNSYIKISGFPYVIGRPNYPMLEYYFPVGKEEILITIDNFPTGKEISEKEKSLILESLIIR